MTALPSYNPRPTPEADESRRGDEGFTFTPSDACKRALDAAVAAALLLALSPLLLCCAAWIWWVDGSPVFYAQWRVGREGWLFRIWKFRTMALDAERHGARFATAGDPRVLAGCSWMRKSHVDELPQLLNILRGEMSFVGPRPERPEKLDELSRDIPGITRRLAVPPGLTGLAQLENGYTNDVAGARRKLAYDLRYLRHRSVLGDVALMLRTIPRFWDRTAC